MSDPTPTPTPAPTGDKWYSGMPEADRGILQNKGWAVDDPKDAFGKVYDAYRNLEKFHGVPADKLLKRPNAGDDAGNKEFWQQLGAGKEPKEYEFTGINFGNDDLNARLVEGFRTEAHASGMPKEMAEKALRFVQKNLSEVEAAKTATAQAETAGQRAELEKSWGPVDGTPFKAAMFIADRAAEALGVDSETMTKLKDGLGGAKVAQLFHQIGQKLGEDTFIKSPSNPNTTMTPEAALARRNELMVDQAWGKRYLEGGVVEMREMTALNNLIANSRGRR